MTKIVLFFQAATLKSKAWRDKIAGVHKYAAKVHWQVQLVPYGASPDEIRYMLETWNPIGCIVDRSFSHARNPTALFKDIPVVLMDQNPATNSGDYSSINCDSIAATQLAADELIRTGVETFSYVPYRLNTDWNLSREKTFASAVRHAGKHFDYWGDSPFTRTLTIAQQDALIAQRLKKLALPCGLLCANDQIAQRVIRVAQKQGIDIPGDMTVVGFDNDEMICENTEPTITSVLPNFHQGGVLAAELLDARIRNPQTKAVFLSYGPLQLIRRQTTQRYVLKDPLVAQAVAIIARKALNPNFHTNELLSELNCSRSLLESRFRQELNRTIREEVQNLRFARALSLLRNPNQAITPIPSLCGYASEPFFKRFFKQRTGLSMREWRKQHPMPE